MRSTCRAAILLLAFLNLLTPLFGSKLTPFIFGASVLAVITGLAVMGPGFRVITAVFSLAGAGLLAYHHLPLSAWMSAFNSMTNVVSILIVMQMFAIPVEAGKYDQAVQYLLNRSVKSQTALFGVTTVVTHVFASFLLFGSIPVIVTLLSNMVKHTVDDWQRFIAASVSRGYSLVSLWAPGAINLFLVAQATGVSWLELFIPGIMLGMVGIATSYLLEAGRLPAKAPPGNNEVYGIEEEVRSKVRTIGWVMLWLIGITVVLETLQFATQSARIALAGAIVIAAWMYRVRKAPEYAAVAARYWREGVLKSADVTALFIAMGVFSTAIEKSGLLVVAQFYLQDTAAALGIFAVVLLPLLIIAASLIGIHPFISVVLVGQVLTSLKLPLPTITQAVCLALGGSISYMVSPFAGVILTLAKYIGCSTKDITFRWNWRFCSLYFIEGILLAYLWGQYVGSR